MRIAIGIALAMCVLGCSDARKFERIRARHPEWATRDTVHDTVTAIVEYVHSDTVWRVRHDTLRIDRDRLHVRTVIAHDTVVQRAWCDADTITIVKDRVVTEWKPSDPWWKAREWWAIVAAILLVILIMKRRS